jgi:hypothetical protein
VGAANELHTLECATQAVDDAHAPSRVKVRAELVDDHHGFAGVQRARLQCTQRGNDVAGETEHRLIAVAEIPEREIRAILLQAHSGTLAGAYAAKRGVARQVHDVTQGARDEIEGALLQFAQPVIGIEKRMKRIEHVL